MGAKRKKPEAKKDPNINQRNKPENADENKNEDKKVENKSDEEKEKKCEDDDSKNSKEMQSSLNNEINKGATKTYADSIKTGIKPKEAKYTIRVRCMITVNKGKSEMESMKTTLSIALGIAKDIDPNSKLMTLSREVENLKDENSISRLDRSNIKNYIDWKIDREEDKKPKDYQKNVGIRITSNTHPKMFMWKWQTMQKVCLEHKREFLRIRMDKMQNATSAFQVGMFVGTSSKQNIERLQKEMEQATGIDGIEVSYQDIYQVGVTEDRWKEMYEKTNIYERGTPAWYETFHKYYQIRTKSNQRDKY